MLCSRVASDLFIVGIRGGLDRQDDLIGYCHVTFIFIVWVCAGISAFFQGPFPISLTRMVA